MSSFNLWILFILAFQVIANNTHSLESISPINSSEFSNKTTSDSLDLSEQKCGGILTDSHGVIQTPRFPEKFQVPITCVWIIDGSMVLGQNVSIFIYLTQLYVLSGLKFTEYMYYSDDYKVPSQNVVVIREEDVTNVTSIKFASPYLEIKFTMDNLHGTHLRVLDHFLDVYGFNITYEVETKTIKMNQCNTKMCSFLGHCFAASNYS